jgi:hypothetical protein
MRKRANKERSVMTIKGERLMPIHGVMRSGFASPLNPLLPSLWGWFNSLLSAKLLKRLSS